MTIDEREIVVKDTMLVDEPEMLQFEPFVGAGFHFK